ncbi:MAG TPA: hypothetical protein ENH91_11620 [Leeuwenhoekiella sp.]|nr:hypothetical protein [Leeuwenhoekiella sp.]
MTFIFALHILLLNTFPCADTSINLDNEQQEMVFSANLDHSHTALDFCTPFCTCHCCHVHTIDFALTSYAPFHTELFSRKFVYNNGLGEEAAYSLLDPPQV